MTSNIVEYNLLIQEQFLITILLLKFPSLIALQKYHKKITQVKFHSLMMSQIPPAFTAEELKFVTQFAEGYNLRDPRYIAWLEANHPEEDSSNSFPLAEYFPDDITPDALCLSDPSPDLDLFRLQMMLTCLFICHLTVLELLLVAVTMLQFQLG